jgi:hypothetical protein
MKKTLFFVLITILILSFALAACSKSSNPSGSLSSSNGGSGTSLSQVNKLLVGTLKLDGTDNAVTAEEAGQLLPLWQAYRSLSTSQTAAQAEVDGLLKQIENTMTSQQVQAITAMNLSDTDLMDLMQSMGGMSPQGTPNPQATPGANFPSGGFPSGDFQTDGQGIPPSGSTGGNPSSSRPSGGGSMQGGGPVIIQGGPGMGGDAGSTAGLGGGPVLQGTPDPTMQARFITQASQVNTMLLNVLINKLQSMANGGK